MLCAPVPRIFTPFLSRKFVSFIAVWPPNATTAPYGFSVLSIVNLAPADQNAGAALFFYTWTFTYTDPNETGNAYFHFDFNDDGSISGEFTLTDVDGSFEIEVNTPDITTFPSILTFTKVE